MSEEAKSLKTVAEHNAGKVAARKKLADIIGRTGVACPKCGQELRWQEGHYHSYFSFPPQTTRPAECKPCRLLIDLET